MMSLTQKRIICLIILKKSYPRVDAEVMIGEDSRAEFANAEVEFLPGWLRLTFVHKGQTRTINFSSEVIASVQTAPAPETECVAMGHVQ